MSDKNIAKNTEKAHQNMTNFTSNPAFRRLSPAFALFCLLTASSAAASPTAAVATTNRLPVVVKNNSVSLKASASIDEDDSKPAFSGDAVTPFTALLKAYPHVRFVHIGWENSNILNFGDTDIFYDRGKHTLTASWRYGDHQSDKAMSGKVRFLSVRESVFAAIVNAHPKGFPENDPELYKIALAHADMYLEWEGFQLLYQPRYGCRSHVLRYNHLISE